MLAARLLLEGMVGIGTCYLGRAMSVCAWPLPLAATGVAEHCRAWADVEEVVGQ